MDALSHVTSNLNIEAVKSILDGFAMATIERADAHDPAVAQTDEVIHKPSQENAVLA